MPTEISFREYCAIYRKAYEGHQNDKNGNTRFLKMIAAAVAKKRAEKAMGRFRKKPKPIPNAMVVPGMIA